MSRHPPTADELLQHSGWLRGLASSLVGPSGADDLVQEAWLRAHRTPPGTGVPTGPWLARVVKNLFYGDLRHEAVRRAGVGPVTETPPTPEELLDRLETQRMLSRLVAELAEPFRTTVLLRYDEGLTSARIAETMNVPPGTVRWRLKEGLDRLRASLDEATGGDREAWRRALVPLLPAAARGAWMLVRVKMAIAMVVMVAAGAGVYMAVKRPRQDATGALPAPSASSPVASKGGANAPETTPSLPPVKGEAGRVVVGRALTVEDRSLASGRIAGHVVNSGSGKGVPGAQLTFAVGGAAATVTADSSGAFELVPAAAGRHVLQVVTAAGYLPFAPPWEQSPVAFEARPGRRVEGVIVYLVPALDYTARVVTADRKPAVGAQVRLISANGGEQVLESIRDEWVTDAKGEVVFHAPDWSLLEARLTGHGRGRAFVDGVVMGTHRVTITLGPAGSKDPAAKSIRGRVVDGTGSPVPGARVTAWHEDQKERMRPHASDETDGEGVFALDGLDDGLHVVEARADGLAPAFRKGVPAGDGKVVLALGPGSILEGRVVDSDGRPVPSFHLVVEKNEGVAGQVVGSRVIVDGDGRFQMVELPAGPMRVHATAAGLAPSPRPIEVTLPKPPARATAIEIRLPRGGRLEGRVVERASGEPIENARVSVEGGPHQGGISAAPFAASATTDENGRFAVGGLAPGKRSVIVNAFEHHGRVVPLDVVDGGSLGPLTIDLAPTKDGEDPRIELVGIGVVLTPTGNTMTIDKVVPGGGAAEVGMVAGDSIVAVEGVPVHTIGMDETISRIRGPEGTTITLTIKKAADGKTVTIQVYRRRIMS
jgi:RNA polymerase sigma factor (sigma-70 family)